MNIEDYNILLAEAMQDVVKKVLIKAADGSIAPNFFITFVTDDEDVILSEDIKAQYPKQMSIILQNKFREFKIFSDKFAVVLSFNQKEQKIVIPFHSIIYFLDRDCNFGMELKRYKLSDSKNDSVQRSPMEKSNKVIDLSERLKKK